FASAMLLAIAGIVFLSAVWVRPKLRLPAIVRELKGHLKAEALTPPSPDAKAENWQRFQRPRPAPERPPKSSRKTAAVPVGEVRLGFYVDWDANAKTSLRAHPNELTHLSPEWLTLSGVESALTVEPDPELAA